jgi:hypothetical protein
MPATKAPKHKIATELPRLAKQIEATERKLQELRAKRDSLILLGNAEWRMSFAALGDLAGMRRESAHYAARRAVTRNGRPKRS